MLRPVLPLSPLGMTLRTILPLARRTPLRAVLCLRALRTALEALRTIRTPLEARLALGPVLPFTPGRTARRAPLWRLASLYLLAALLELGAAVGIAAALPSLAGLLLSLLGLPALLPLLAPGCIGASAGVLLLCDGALTWRDVRLCRATVKNGTALRALLRRTLLDLAPASPAAFTSATARAAHLWTTTAALAALAAAPAAIALLRVGCGVENVSSIGCRYECQFARRCERGHQCNRGCRQGQFSGRHGLPPWFQEATIGQLTRP